MEQTNMVMAMYQAMASQGMVPKVNTAADKASGDFQKLLDQKAQTPDKNDAPVDDKASNAAASVKKDEAPVQEEDSLEQVKKLAEQGYTVFMPTVGMVTADGQSFEPGEYVLAWKETSVQFIPVTDLDEGQLEQLNQLVGDLGKTIDVSDPKADAMLEATAPGADNSPAALLEKMVEEQTGQTMQQAMTDAQPQKKDEQAEAIDVEQAPQQLFHDVKAAPVKVGEAYNAQQTQEPDVAGQIDAQLAQALQAGDTTVRIQLTPENLGEVTVEISQSADGALHVELTAHNADTRGLLERHAGDLQGMLTNRTQQSVEVNVQRQQESQQNQNQQHQRSYDGHNGHAQDGQQRRQQHREPTSPEDFMQQLRLGLIPTDVEL